ncbi:tail fiber protein [Aquimarina sp. TRL1]|uniref:tail fiber protein n=1 Tax=Aquimarina sp. (strain TRL1) TaxID=2736252 RepID=UPI00158A7AE5|nr:tail fiber protein [Aquimarina sp. TRL1]QKX05462.1 tail fiber protein [Aquimarina sp. TRL1]
MKTKLLFIVAVLFTAVLFAQNTGIAVQGIARDASKTALGNKNLNFVFDIQISNGTSKYKETQNLTTDAFGVFSHVIGTGTPQGTTFSEVDFSTEHLKLVISLDGTVISDQPFHYAPYAYHANNGAPTGAIMPYLGATAPPGWLLCNGTAIPNPSTSGAALVALIGNNTPNLQGMFLRGTGTSPVNGQSGPGLKATQSDTFKSHNHYVNLTTSSNGSHSHGYDDYAHSDSVADHSDHGTGSGDDNGNKRTSRTTASAGNHTHTVKGNSNTTGGAETRPVNYGVNYIIKL